MRNLKILLGVLFLALFSACTVVGPGEVGVEVYFGTIQGGVKSPGLYTTVLSDVYKMSTRTQTYTMAGGGNEAAVNGSVNVLARDQLPVSLDVSVMFHLDGQRAIDVYRSFGANYDDSIVHPLVRTAVRDAASEFNAVDLIDRRSELQVRMTELVRTQLAATLRGRNVNDRAVVIDNVLIRNIDLPATIDEAIANVQRQRQATAERTQANLTAQQEAARQLTVANGESAALVARTEADARMTRIRSEAQAAANRVLSASLTPEFLAYERIQATRAVLQSNSTRTVFLPGGTSPGMLMNLPTQ
jgi:regulator of protease activity HflC (stomatin/prohibitin superfamily)